MEQDKIVSDVADKRKIEDDNHEPKPNTKRIKLVRPVFSPVVKPLITSRIVICKSDVQPIEVSKSSIPSDKIRNMIDISQTSDKSIDQPEIIKTHTEQLESIKNSITVPSIPEEQIVSSSDDLQNLFSEETKKELEHLKKNIFKIDDDGSSSENDSQPKRPRLKRPTFVTSAIENKNESNEMTILDKMNDTSKLDVTKSVCEENKAISNDKTILDKINNRSKLNLTKSIREKNNIESNDVTDFNKINNKSKLDITKSICEENITQTQNVGKVDTTSVDKIIEETPIIIENTNEEIKNKSIVLYNIDKFKEKSLKKDNEITEEIPILIKNKEIEHTTTENIEIITKDKTKNVGEVIEEVRIEVGNLCEIKKHNDDKIELKIIKNDLPEENIEKTLTDIKGEKELDNDRINQTIEEKEKTKSMAIKEAKKDKIRILLERFDKKLIDKLNNENNYNVDVDVNDKTEVKTDTLKMIKDVDDSSLKTEKQASQETDVIDNDSKCNNDLLLKQNDEESESQIFKSDILKAALMSKKSSEMLINSLETQDQIDSIHSTSLETKMTEVLPKIGEEAIVNKIEAEIKLANKDHLSNNTNLQNKMNCNVNDVTEISTSKEISSSIGYNENVTVENHNELPKWGSAKMNEVEKFLNDSNVTITPICKSQESPKLGKITLKLTKDGIPEIKSESTVRSNVKSELIKKITNKQIAMGDSPLKSALSQPNKSFGDFATIRPSPKPSAEQIALLEQQILNTPKKRGRPSKILTQQKQLLLQYQQLQQPKVNEGNSGDDTVFHVPLFDMEDMSGVTGMFDTFNASTPKKEKSIRGKGSRGRRGRGGGHSRGHDGSDSDTANSRRRDDEGEVFHEEINQEEETKQVAMIEAERLRKEEERERKLEARKKKLKERNDAIKEKKMRKKQKAEERRLQWHEKKRLMQEEKLRAAEMKKSLPPPQNFDDETRMSADCNNSRSQTPARNFMIGEDDLSISCTTNDSLRLKKGRMEVIDLESNKTLTVDQIAEYQWPLEGGELYMIQEQISNFLGVKSFKRKYPGLKRRNVEAEERTFLCDSGLVAESLCDLGLTVLYSSEVLDIMYTDFPEKYEELREYMRLKHAKELTNRQRALMTISSNADGSKLDLRDRTMEAVANWNASLNKSRLESRKCSMDMQTFIVHYPKNKCKKMTIPKPKIGSYPLALLPGQFCDYYATYSSEDLRYLPINTVMYGPMKSIDKDFPVSLSSQSESEDSSSEDSSDSDDSIDIDNKSGKNNLEYGPSDKKGAECKHCLGTADKNKKGTVEPLIHCSKCLSIYHPTCLDMTLEMVPYIKRYNWQCNECKFCAQCKEVADEDKMLFCDLCDRGYHIYCVGLRRVPEGRWHCQECAMCSSCGVSDPGPGDSKWFYEFKKIEKTGSKVYCRTLCAPCSRLWKKGHYCPNCMRCYPIKNVERMTQCNSCDRYLHPECINENTSNSRVVTCTMCEEKAVSRLLTTVPRSLIKV